MISKTDICVGRNRKHHGDSTFRANPGGTPYNGLCGKALPERSTFLTLQVYERGRGISPVKLYERVRKSVNSI